MNCRHPDRDNPKLLCGYPLPCPYHTAIVDLDATPVPTVTIPLTSDACAHTARLGDLTRALARPALRRRRKRRRSR